MKGLGLSIVVDVYGIHARIQGSFHIYFQAITNHQTFSGPGTGALKGKVKNFLFGFEAVAVFGSDDVLEIRCQPAVAKLAVLRFIKAIGDEVKRIAF